MQDIGGTLLLSASDLVGYLSCRHLTELDKLVAGGKRPAPKRWDPALEVLKERGARHEAAYVEHLAHKGLIVERIAGKGIDQGAVTATVAAMKAGRAVIVQAALANKIWQGRADVLLRVSATSAFGDWGYEVVDTKLARHTQSGTVLQLCVYSDLVTEIQGRAPDRMHVVSPWVNFEPESFRFADYAAYFRQVRAQLTVAAKALEQSTYPAPTAHCEICRWREECEGRRRADDHLCYVAGLGKRHVTELRPQNITKLAQLAGMAVPLQWKPERGSPETFQRLREQARVQAAGRVAGKPLFEPLSTGAGQGLARLPDPSAGDVFFDLEGDPFVEDGGLEFLFGYVFDLNGVETYAGKWSLSHSDERTAFEAFVDFVIERWKTFPDMHVYHFAPYEVGALKRMMGRHASREEQIDRLLRGGVFIDLHAVVRQAVLASVESYSIKKLEPFYEFTRSVPLSDASAHIFAVQRALELAELDALDPLSKAIVEGYNRDDCVSARRLRDWLETVRNTLVAEGWDLPRPAVAEDEAPAAVSEQQAKADALRTRLHLLPHGADPSTLEYQARWVLGHLLDWHRREEKVQWWEFYRLADLPPEDLINERAAIGGLTFVQSVGGTAKAPIHRYAFPPQELDLRGGEDLILPGGKKFGKIETMSAEDGTVDIKKRKDTADVHPDAAFSHSVVPSKTLVESLMRLGEWVADHGIDADASDHRAARDLLLRRSPRTNGEAIRLKGESASDAARRVVKVMQAGVMPVQGPPGTGKTHIGGQLICDLVAAGKKVGVTATSHKVIRNLLDKALELASKAKQAIQCVAKVSEAEDEVPGIKFATDYEDVKAAVDDGARVVAGTAWLWARPDFAGFVDVLFVDEAAQMALANVLAIAQATGTLILLGDPQQLEQPQQGSHPPGTEVSALDHILQGSQTIAEDKGLFLDETWRLHPRICDFTSEVFYEGRLRARPDLERQEVKGKSSLAGNGLRLVKLDHHGHQSSCPEEAAYIATAIAELTDGKHAWIDREGESQVLTLKEILVVAPFNVQVHEIRRRIPGARVGTVDKFQGQEAPVVFYSMTASSPEDAPHGMEFLFSLNRLNVATSRARCLSVVVASSQLFAPECRTPDQMRLANALCRYAELTV